MRHLVVGSEGFLGRHLMEQGRSMGHDMIGCDISGNPDIPLLAEQVSDTLLKRLHCERVIDCAGVLGTQETLANPTEAVAGNITTALNVLTACRDAGVPIAYLTLGNDWLNPYSITKNCAAEFVRMFNRVYELPTQVAVCYNAYGPFQKWKPVRKIVPEFMTKLLRDEEIELFFGGEQLVDMCYAPDVARSVLNDHSTGVRHYGSGRAMTVLSVLMECGKALGIEPKWRDAGHRPGETGAAAIAPYGMPTITQFQDAIRTTAAWYRRQQI